MEKPVLVTDALCSGDGGDTDSSGAQRKSACSVCSQAELRPEYGRGNDEADVGCV